MIHRTKRNYAIGVFDSGLGGLTVVKELMGQLPDEDIIYFGDTARVPYGIKSKESVIRFSIENVSFLLKHKVKLIVVACNTSSSFALPILRRKFSVPMIGVIMPGAKKAAAITKNKRVGVIATSATINSQSYVKSIQQLDQKIRVISQDCPLFVPLAEAGWFDNKITLLTAQEYLKTIIEKRVDTLILGCTHYPLLKSTIKKVVGKRVVLIDSAKEVANEVKQFLNNKQMQINKKYRSHCVFWVSDEPQHFRTLARRFLRSDIKKVKRHSHV